MHLGFEFFKDFIVWDWGIQWVGQAILNLKVGRSIHEASSYLIYSLRFRISFGSVNNTFSRCF